MERLRILRLRRRENALRRALRFYDEALWIEGSPGFERRRARAQRLDRLPKWLDNACCACALLSLANYISAMLVNTWIANETLIREPLAFLGAPLEQSSIFLGLPCLLALILAQPVFSELSELKGWARLRDAHSRGDIRSRLQTRLSDTLARLDQASVRLAASSGPQAPRRPARRL